MAPSQNPVSPQEDSDREIRRELEEVCASPLFRRSETACRLLRYLVERQLAGRGGELKETVVAQEVFGLGSQYDPKLDSIVRVNANRLRIRLEDHYRTHKARAVRIVLQKGTYVPSYEWHPRPRQGPPRQPEVLPATPLPPPVDTADRKVQPLVGRSTRWIIPATLAFLGVLCAALVLTGQYRQAPRQNVTAPGVHTIHRFGSPDVLTEFAEFSPDGKTLAFVSAPDGSSRHAIYLQGVNSDQAHRLNETRYAEERPSWSPDGGQIAYLQMLDNTHKQVIIEKPDTGEKEPIATVQGGPLWLCSIPRLTWARDGSHLFTSASQAPGAPCGLIAVDLKSHNISSLIAPVLGSSGDLEPSVSPDGNSLAFVRNYSYGRSQIFLLRLSDRSLRPLTRETSDILGFSWCADGSSIVLASNRVDGEQRLWQMSLGTGEMSAITDGTSSPAFPSVSLNQQVVFTNFRRESSIWRADRNGSMPVVDDGANNLYPKLSPDGRQLLFTSDRSGPPMVWISDASGQHGHRFVPDRQLTSGHAVWSPDGSEIAFECRSEITQICLADASGSNVRQLTEGPSNKTAPSWSSNGQSVYYTLDLKDRKEIFRQDIHLTTPQQVTHNGGEFAVESIDGRWLYLRPLQALQGISIEALRPQSDPQETENIAKLLGRLPHNIAYWQPYQDGLVSIETEEKGHRPFLVMHPFGSQTRRKLYPVEYYEGLDASDFSSSLPAGVTFYAVKRYKVQLNITNLESPDKSVTNAALEVPAAH